MSKIWNTSSSIYMSKKDRMQSWLLVFLLFFLTSPYFFWKWYGNLFVTLLVSTIAMLIIWKYTGRLTKKQKSVYAFYVFVWLLYLLNEFFKGARLGVLAYIPYVLMGFVPFVNKDFCKKVFSNFTTVYAILIGISMVSWIAAMTGVISPIGQIGEGNDLLEAQQKTYLVYPLSLVSTQNIAEFTRFCAFFDESGMVGTLGGLILCALRFNMKDWRCIIIFLSGLLSASMFFYGLAAVYWLTELILVKKKYTVFLLIIASIFTFYLATKNNDALSYLVWDRFEWDSDKGGFAGNTREGERTTLAMERIWSSGEIWFGVKDKEAFLDEVKGTSSIYNVFALYGFIFVALYIVWQLMFGYRYKVNKWDYLLYCFVVIGSMYQRPNLFSLSYTFLFVCIARYYEFQLTYENVGSQRRDVSRKVKA